MIKIRARRSDRDVGEPETETVFGGARLEKQQCLRMGLESCQLFVSDIYLGLRLASVVHNRAGALHTGRVRSKFSVG